MQPTPDQAEDAGGKEVVAVRGHRPEPEEQSWMGWIGVTTCQWLGDWGEGVTAVPL